MEGIHSFMSGALKKVISIQNRNNNMRFSKSLKVRLLFGLVLLLFMLSSIPGKAQISFVARAAANGTALNFSSIPGWQPGDLALVFAFRSRSTTAPSNPTGFSSITTESSSYTSWFWPYKASARLSYRYLQSGDGSYNFANAAAVEVIVLRGTLAASPIIQNSTNGATSSSNVLRYSALAESTLSSSWIMGFGGHRNANDVNTALASPMTTQSAITVNTLGMHSLTGVTTFNATNWSQVSSSSNWVTILVEVGALPLSITTGAVAPSPFCLDGSTPLNGTVAYTSTGNFSDARFTAYLSDAEGNFESATQIGSLSGISGLNPSGNINIAIPAGTAAGTGYKIRIDCDDPEITGSESSAIVVINGATDVTSVAASPGNGEATLTWTNPPACYDEIMIVGKAGNRVTVAPSGDGMSYNPNPVFGSGSEFGGGYVVYKGVTSPQTITALTNGTTYFFTFFTRLGTSWSTGTTISTTPYEPSIGDYRSVQDGNWATATTWEYYTGSAWTTPSSGPASGNNIITVRNGHTVTVTAAVTVDQVIVESGGKVTVNNVTMTIADEEGDDFVVNGTLELTGTSGIIATEGNLVFNDESHYYHRRIIGTIPLATWNSGSTCHVDSETDATAYPGGVDQTFWHFTWNYRAGSNLWGNGFQQTSMKILGDLTIEGTGSKDIGFSNNTDPALNNFTVGGNLNILTGGMYRVCYNYSATLNVLGNVNINGGTLVMNSSDNGGQSGGRIGTATVDGDFTITNGGTLNFVENGRAPRDEDLGILRIKGDFTHQAGTTITEGCQVQDGNNMIDFIGTGQQIYTSGDTVSNTVNFNVSSGAYLQMAANNTVITGGGTFTLAGGATLGITSPDGITASDTVGNIQVRGTRTFDTGANYIYNGTVAQNTGNGLPATVGNLTFDNTVGDVTFNSARTITNNFSITTNSKANLGTGLTHTTSSLTLGGTVAASGQSYGGMGSGAQNIDPVYFASSSGIINVGTGMPPGSWRANAISSEWDNGANWHGNAVPGAGTDVIIPGSTNYYPVIYSTTNANCLNLTIATGASLTIESGPTSSGSLIVNGTSTGNVTYERTIPDDGEIQLWHYIASPVAPVSIESDKDFYPYDEPSGDWGSATTTIESGTGYTVIGGGSISFTGMVVNTDVVVDVTSPYTTDVVTGTEEEYASRWTRTNYGGGGFNLLGNPYTSSISATAFIAQNDEVFDPFYKAVYLYNGDSYNYIGNAVEGWDLNDPNQLSQNIQAGQGFFVLAEKDNTQFTFTRAMQAHSSDAVLLKSSKTGNRWPGLKLNVACGDVSSSTLLVFNQEMSTGLDAGYDIGLMSSGADIEIYSKMIEKGIAVNLTRQALPENVNAKDVIPVGIDFPRGGNVVFSADVEPLKNLRFWLEDRKTGIYTDLGTNTYTVNLPEKTYGTGRFFIIASTNTPTGIERPGTDDSGIRIWTSNGKVIIKGEVTEQAVCELYDLNGKKMLEKKLTDTGMNTIDLPAGLKGVVMVRVTDGIKITTRKIAVI